jgi:hypothetical protein
MQLWAQAFKHLLGQTVFGNPHKLRDTDINPTQTGQDLAKMMVNNPFHRGKKQAHRTKNRKKTDTDWKCGDILPNMSENN